MKFNNIAEAIGHTPLIKLGRLPTDNSATVFVKMESFNPGSSVKDRIGFSMIEAAEKSGQLKPGMTIVEPTSGNTGIALAMVAAAKGYKCVFTMPETMSLERRALLKAYGAEIVLTPGTGGMKGAIAKASELTQKLTAFQPFQFSNPANPRIHRETTGPEIVADMANETVDAFIAGVGTGGTLSGTGVVLKDKFKARIYAVEPQASAVLSGDKPGPHPIQGIGAGFIPDNYDADVIDEIIKVRAEDALATARRLATEEGILAGISSGANVWAALKVAANLSAEHNVVTIICDSGERYLSTVLFNQEN